VAESLGTGFLSLNNFRRIVDENPKVSRIELSNWGEILLNRELPAMLGYAFRRGVALQAGNGVNLNTLPDEVLESMVRYGLRKLTVSIDGATQETYQAYRVGGDLERVLYNIGRINDLKESLGARFPELNWQFIVFGHNEHEVTRARSMAADLGMGFMIKLPWEDLYTEPFSPVKNLGLVRRVSGLGVANRGEYRSRYGHEYMLRQCCLSLWVNPQVNYDGRLLGCPVNYWGDYGNVLKEGLYRSLNGEKIAYAREMLMGRVPEREDVPCTRCRAYRFMRDAGRWIKEGDIKGGYAPRRLVVFSENSALGYDRSHWVVDRYSAVKRLSGIVGRVLRREEKLDLGYLASTVRSLGKASGPRVGSGTYPLRLPLSPDEHSGWRPYPLFRGSTRNIYDLSCHASALSPGSCPHPPHTHAEEEILLMLSGELEVTLPDPSSGEDEERVILEPGRFVYYPSNLLHTIQSRGDETTNYLMFKWTSAGRSRQSELGFRYHSTLPGEYGEEGSSPVVGFSTRVVFEGPTRYLERLNCHCSVLLPGAGYEPHSDRYDVCLVMLEGEAETIGKRVHPFDVVFYAAGVPHGISNPGSSDARYVVFEFHGR